MGSPEIQLTYEKFLNSIHPDDRERVTREYYRIIHENQTGEVLIRIILPDGRVKHLYIRGRAEYSAEDIPEKTIGTIQDITAG